MPQPIINNRAFRAPLGAVAASIPFETPVNPISFYNLCFEATDAAGVGTIGWLEFLAKITQVNFSYFNRSIVSVSGEHLLEVVQALRVGNALGIKPANAAGRVLQLNMILPFGRKLWDPNEAFPAVRQGETELTISVGADGANLSGYTVTINEVTMPYANPARFLRYTERQFIPAATGEQATDINRVATLLGIGVESGDMYPVNVTPTYNMIQLLIDDQEAWFNNTDCSFVRYLTQIDRAEAPDVWDHIDTTAGTLLPTDQGDVPSRFAYLDFDPTKDGSLAIPAATLASLQLQFNVLATNPINIVPVYIYTPGQLAIGGL